MGILQIFDQYIERIFEVFNINNLANCIFD